MNSSTWDDEAEAYLRSVIYRDNGLGCGGVPCAWPTSIFELSWVRHVLLPEFRLITNIWRTILIRLLLLWQQLEYR